MKSSKSALKVVESSPDGFSIVTGVNEIDYLVPEFMVPMVNHVQDRQEQMSALTVGLQDGGVSTVTMLC